MKVLVGCEESGVVREAFAKRGHDAWSCDILPSRTPGQHIQDDVLKHLDKGWDLIILHPPCTYTSLSGNRWYYNSPLRTEGAMLTMSMWEMANKYCERVALEQPKTIMQKYLGEKSQVIQPYQFGHGETKETWLWLRGLPLLVPTNEVDGRENRIWKMPPGPNRQRDRSVTFQGVADAMAEQWG